MSYDPPPWEDAPSMDTPLSAERLNLLDAAIRDALVTVVHVSADYTAAVGERVVVDAAGFSNASPLVVTLPAAPVDGGVVSVCVTGTGEQFPVQVVPSGDDGVRLGAVTSSLLSVASVSSAQLVYSAADEVWDVFSDITALGMNTVRLSLGALEAEGDNDETTYLRGDGTWARIERNPVAVEAAHTATPGEDIYCVYGGYQITIPDGERHGQTITATTGPHLLTGTDVDVEYFNLTNQNTEITTLPYTGALITLRWLQDVDFGGFTVSGWAPTTITTIDTAPASP